MIPGLESWGSGHIWAEYRSPIDGVLLAGMVTITLPVRLTNTADDAIIPHGVVLDKFVLNTMEGNSFHIELPATDDPDIDQIGWGYDIMVVLEGFGANPLTVETFSGVPVPLDGATNLRLLVPNETTIIGPASWDLSKFARVNAQGEVTDANGNVLSTGGEGGGVTLSQVNAAITTHRNDPIPHPVYDDMQDLKVLLENAML